MTTEVTPYLLSVTHLYLGSSQGGYSSAIGGNFTKSFPIKFSEILHVDFMCVVNAGPDGGSSGHWVKSYSKTSFSGACNFSSGAPFLWIAFGT